MYIQPLNNQSTTTLCSDLKNFQLNNQNVTTSDEGLIVLSLFDGISCGKVALERIGLKISKYYASEIDKNAIRISEKNHPDIIHIGDVSKVSYKDGRLFTETGTYDIGRVDLLIGGSPCTDFSIRGNMAGMSSEEGNITTLSQYLKLKERGVGFTGQSYLFWEYVRIKEEVKPKHFLLENVRMQDEWLNIINEAVGCQPVTINSRLVSAQNRIRLYWTDVNISLPKDKNITIRDILDKDIEGTDITYCLTLKRAMKDLMEKYNYIPEIFNPYNRYIIKDKAPTLTTGSLLTGSCGVAFFSKGTAHTVRNGVMDGEYPVKVSDGTYNIRALESKELERLQTLPEGYTDIPDMKMSKISKAIGNGWTVDVIAHIFRQIYKDKEISS